MSKFLFLLIITFFLCARSIASGDDTKATLVGSNNGNDMTTTSEGLVSLGKDVQKRSDKKSVAGSASAMASLLKQWNPVGKSTSDLVTLIGPADVKKTNQLVYRFDSGLGGNEWLFETEKEKVVSVTRRSLD